VLHQKLIGTICVFLSVLTAAQHGDARRHIQIQGRFKRVSSRCTHTAAQQQELQRRGSSSLHLSRASHGTNTLQPGYIHMQRHSRKHIHLVVHVRPCKRTHKHTHSLWQTLAGSLVQRAVGRTEETWKDKTETHTKPTVLEVMSTQEGRQNAAHVGAATENVTPQKVRGEVREEGKLVKLNGRAQT